MTPELFLIYRLSTVIALIVWLVFYPYSEAKNEIDLIRWKLDSRISYLVGMRKFLTFIVLFIFLRILDQTFMGNNIILFFLFVVGILFTLSLLANSRIVYMIKEIPMWYKYLNVYLIIYGCIKLILSILYFFIVVYSTVFQQV